MSRFIRRKKTKINLKTRLKKKVEESPLWLKALLDFVEMPPMDTVFRRLFLFAFMGDHRSIENMLSESINRTCHWKYLEEHMSLRVTIVSTAYTASPVIAGDQIDDLLEPPRHPRTLTDHRSKQRIRPPDSTGNSTTITENPFQRQYWNDWDFDILNKDSKNEPSTFTS
ncbi:hypothetical protein Bca4012_059412 [Brassica carinata]|uniref:Uncharacterized protein n=1 Tax=Brassica carinata TaxID=52824 RepID=A0A8X7V516_BRACI|nr:hypothetical protein Bca52824_029867 [Brassica carinata]